MDLPRWAQWVGGFSDNRGSADSEVPDQHQQWSLEISETGDILRSTPCNYGGQRTWLLCPHCSRRVTVLYKIGKKFLCRHCGELTYSSQQENAASRKITKSFKIMERLGGDPSAGFHLPPRPKGMHHTTYWRLCKQALDAQQTGWRMAEEDFGPSFGLG